MWRIFNQRGFIDQFCKWNFRPKIGESHVGFKLWAGRSHVILLIIYERNSRFASVSSFRDHDITSCVGWCNKSVTKSEPYHSLRCMFFNLCSSGHKIDVRNGKLVHTEPFWLPLLCVLCEKRNHKQFSKKFYLVAFNFSMKKMFSQFHFWNHSREKLQKFFSWISHSRTVTITAATENKSQFVVNDPISYLGRTLQQRSDDKRSRDEKHITRVEPVSSHDAVWCLTTRNRKQVDKQIGGGR